ncbi:MAG TPA: hypothetical protein G4N92_02250 [Anaerolineae bacterium]|nr:hypothetical protein [Anaerolineae bacterium]
MKKTMSLLVLICIATSLTACHKEVEEVATVTATEVKIQQPQKLIISAENISELKEVRSLNTKESVTCKWSSDGKTFWLVGLQEAKLYDSATFGEVAGYDVSEYAALYDVSSDGSTLAYSLDGAEIILYDVLKQDEIRIIQPDFYYHYASFSPDGKFLAIMSLDEIQANIWDVSTGKNVTTLEGFMTAAPVYSGRIAEDGKTFLWISRGTVQPMNIESKTMGPEFSHEDFVTSIALSPDGKILATTAAGTVNGEFTPLVKLWDPASGEELGYFTNADPFTSLTLSPNGSILAAGTKKTVIIWDAKNHNQLTTLLAYDEYINSLAFSPDGTQLVSCGTEGTVKIWKIVK